MNNTSYHQYLSEQIDDCLRGCGDAWEDSVNNHLNSVSEKLKSTFEDIIDLQQDFRLYQDSRRSLQNLNDFSTVIDFMEQLRITRGQQLLNEKAGIIAKQISKFKTDEEEIVFEGGDETLGLICPLTSRIPETPVISVKCKHVYEKNAILNYIRHGSGGGQVSCPVAGCGQFITAKDIREDEHISKAVLEAKKKDRAEEYQKLK